jgi:hypothetical protein
LEKIDRRTGKSIEVCLLLLVGTLLTLVECPQVHQVW